MMKAARSLMSWSLKLAPPLTGILADPGSPGWWTRPLVIVLMMNAGSRGFATPGSLKIGFKAGPMPPVRLAPRQAEQLAANTAAPLVGFPGSGTALPEGEGELAAIVLMAVSATMAGTASATSADSANPL